MATCLQCRTGGLQSRGLHWTFFCVLDDAADPKWIWTRRIMVCNDGSSHWIEETIGELLALSGALGQIEQDRIDAQNATYSTSDDERQLFALEVQSRRGSDFSWYCNQPIMAIGTAKIWQLRTVQLIVIGGDGITAEQSLAIKLILLGNRIKKEVNQHCPFVGDDRLLALPLSLSIYIYSLKRSCNRISYWDNNCTIDVLFPL